jgi:drug/metabolite transporter (DMT)-like permease
MNILSFVALQYIGAGEFTISAQLKILTTAGFSTVILGTTLSSVKWRALFLLVLGCLLVASPAFNHPAGQEAKTTSVGLQMLGYAAVLSEVRLATVDVGVVVGVVALLPFFFLPACRCMLGAFVLVVDSTFFFFSPRLML